VRSISPDFQYGTTTADHPVGLLVALLLGAGLVWIGYEKNTNTFNTVGKMTWEVIIFGLLCRALFMGSTPIYEDDWNRYLWDGAVTAQGHNPYTYSPHEVLTLEESSPERSALHTLSQKHPDIAERINHPKLTTIYPPIAQAVFGLGALIKPFDVNTLRWLFLLSEGASLFLLVKALNLYGRSPIWSALYALNPIVIFTSFNALHMDILMVPFILGAIILVKNHPLKAALCLAGAVGVKLWPLILGPVLFRRNIPNLKTYILYGAALGAASLLICLPILLSLGEQSGLAAYAKDWQRSSLIFPLLSEILTVFSDNSDRLTRYGVAGIVAASAFAFALRKSVHINDMPSALLWLVIIFFLLSPTGFPWYVIWFAFLLPFAPTYGAALLCVTVGLYYSRFWLGENGHHDIYVNILVPIQFGAPLILMMAEAWHRKRRLHV